MLEERPGSGSFKAGIALSLLFGESMVIATSQRVEPQAIALKGPMESFLRLFGEKGKVKLPPKGIGLLTNVEELLIEP